MAYNRELAKQICRELGIKWNPNAKCATVAGEPIKTESISETDIFEYGPNDNMINILSYQQPIKGKIIKEWIAFHTTNKTEYSRIAVKMLRYMNVKSDRMYRVNLRLLVEGINDITQILCYVITIELV